VAQADLIIETTPIWGQSVVLWNLALDQKSRTASGWLHRLPRRSNYRPLEITSDGHPTVDFTALAHASNFVSPGALRIDSPSSEESPLKHVAFRNSDGSIVLLALNPSESAITFGIAWQSQYATYMLQPGAVVTFHWSPKLRTATSQRDRGDSTCLFRGIYCGLEDAARLWSSAVRSNSVWLGPELSSLCTTFPIDSVRPDHPARVAPPFLSPVVRLLTFPAANMPCPASSGKSHLSARVRLLFGAAESLRPPAIVPSANFPSLETVARSDARFALAIGLPCDTHPSPHPVALPIPKSIPNCFLPWRHADPAAAPLRMLCVLRERGFRVIRAPQKVPGFLFFGSASTAFSSHLIAVRIVIQQNIVSIQRSSNRHRQVPDIAPPLYTSPATLRLCPPGATRSQANTALHWQQHAPEDNAAGTLCRREFL